MKKELKGFTKIFAFTFRQQVCRKGYLAVTITVALLCLLIPAAVLAGCAWIGQDNGSVQTSPEPGMEAAEVQPENRQEMSAPLSDAVKNIFVVNLTGSDQFSAKALESFDFKGNLDVEMPDVAWKDYGEDFEQAGADSAGTADTLILTADLQGDMFALKLLYPEESGLEEEAYMLADGIAAYGDWAAAGLNAAAGGSTGDNEAAGESGSAGEENAGGDDAGGDDAGGEMGGSYEEDTMDSVRSVLSMVCSYLNIMVLYFFVLLYGQGVAQSVITEKSSKLMEFFLVSVRPAAMILGKMTAVCLSGVLQLFSWLLCLAAGFSAGSVLARSIDPDVDMMVLQVLDSFGALTDGMFSVGGIILALLLLLSGMLLYCALAGIGGAVAGKSEDLSSANVAFTLILIASFFACLFAGGLSGTGNVAGWLDWIPFTAIMVTPARVLLGSVSLLKGTGCLLVIAASALLLTLLAGRLYRLMALYKGELPGPKKLVSMLRSEK